jgi:hypothetical protein
MINSSYFEGGFSAFNHSFAFCYDLQQHIPTVRYQTLKMMSSNALV